MVSEHVLRVEQVSKSYGDMLAVDQVSFSVKRGQIVGLLGPNGAGKTTIINMVLGVLLPSQGHITIDDIDLRKERSEALARTNFAAVYAALPGNMTLLQNLHVFGLLYGVSQLSERIEEVIQQFDLVAFRHTKCGVLSSGEQTRVSLAKAMLNRPALLLLDEPTASLDPATAQDIRQRIGGFVRNGSSGVLWTSHNMMEVEQMCDHVLFISHGKILLQGHPKTLPQEYGKSDLETLFVTVAKEPLSLKEVL